MREKLSRRVFACGFCLIGLSGVVVADHISPDEFTVADGFEVTLWATTPQLQNPTNFDIDAQGRIWVTEAVNYRNFRNADLGLGSEAGDRVVVIEDTDGNGSADTAHTFVRDPDLVAPLGIAVLGNKVVVSCAPNLIVFTDIDGDARFDPEVDTKEVLLTGFSGLDHDHSLHSVTVGPDGFWYFNTGNGGPHTVTDKTGWTLRAGSSYAGGSPHLKENFPGRKSDDGRVWVGGVAMRMRPDGTGLEPIGHNFRNVYEESLSSFGDVFHADNDDPPACRTTWLMKYGNLGFSAADGSRKWQVDQRPGQPTRVAEWRQEDPGVIPAGDVYGFGAPTGVVFGENGCFDDAYPQGLLLVCESARGEVFSYVPKPQGAGFALNREVFLKLRHGSPDAGMFRPSDIAIGPDGAIYVSDWYDAGVGGHRMTDASGSGSIYRIAPPGFVPSPSRFDLSTVAGQVTALKSPALHVRSLGLEALRQQGAAVTGAVVELSQSQNSFFVARSAWLLPGCGEAGIDRLQELLRHGNAQIRIVALRSLRQAATEAGAGEAIKDAWRSACEHAATDKSAAVRREVAVSLRDVPFAECSGLLRSLGEQFDGWDRWYLEALGIACEGKESDAYALLVGESAGDPSVWEHRHAEIAWRLHPPQAIAALEQRALDLDLSLADRKRMVDALAFVNDPRAAVAMLAIATGGAEDLRGYASWWGNHRLTNDWQGVKPKVEFPAPPVVQRVATKTRPDTTFLPSGRPVYESQDNQADIDLEVTGVERLYLVVDSADRKMVEAIWIDPTLNTSGGAVSLTTLPWTMAFSQAPPSGPPAPAATQLGKKAKPQRPPQTRLPGLVPTSTGHPAIRVEGRAVIAYDIGKLKGSRFRVQGRVSDAGGRSGDAVRFSVYADRTPVGAAIPPAAELIGLEASATLGRAVFHSSRVGCAKCHAVAGYGGEIGPDLTHIGKKHSALALYEDILKPHAALATGFETMNILTASGKLISGLQVSAGNPVVLKDATGVTHAVDREEIDEIMPGRTSLMPELGSLLTANELASIIAFLQTAGE